MSTTQYRQAHREELVLKQRQYHQEHREQDLASMRAYQAAHKPQGRQKARERYARNPEAYLAYQRAWRLANLESCKARRIANHAGVRSAILDVLGRQCVHCGYADERALCIDHVHDDGYKDKYRGKLLYILEHVDSGNYQTLCANCNMIKARQLS